MKIQGYPTIGLELTIRLNEEEVRAIEALGGYGDDKFIEVFYKHIGKEYMKAHEEGLRSFLQSSRNLAQWLHRIDEARKIFKREEE